MSNISDFRLQIHLSLWVCFLLLGMIGAVGVTALIGRGLAGQRVLAAALRQTEASLTRAVYVIDIGRNLATVTHAALPHSAQHMVWSPDGTHFVYAAGSNGSDGLYTAEMGHGQPRLLAGAPIHEPVSWSPDGRSVAYSDPMGSGIRVIDVISGESFTLFQAAGMIRYPAWSPGGEMVAFLAAHDQGWGLYAGHIQSQDSRLINPDVVSSSATQPVWSPDEKSIALTIRQGGSGDIMVLRLADGAAERFTDSREVDFEPLWSPDGTRIAYWTPDDYGTYVQIAPATGGNPLRVYVRDILWSRSEVHAAWSADSRHLAFGITMSDGTSRLYDVNTENGEATLLLTGFGDVPYPAWLS